MASAHYFTNEDDRNYAPRSIDVTLAGRRVTVTTSGGMFSPEHVDRGTGILLSHVSEPPNEGNLLDLGCGWGPIALSMAMLSPNATVWAVDVNDRALELTRQNAEKLGLTNVQTARPEEVPAELQFAEIWSNPPIRVGKAVLHEMLQTWLSRLEEGCEAHLIVAKKLGSDSLQRWMHEELGHLGSTERTGNDAGFRILSFTRG